MDKAEDTKIVQTDVGNKDGQDKCPKCGSTDISTNISSEKLRCNFCRHEFTPEKVAGLETDLTKLEGQTIASGAKDIVANTDEVLTFKCESCGAEVVIDASQTTQARCHWCRNTLSINQQIPNGAVPDVVLPFKITKDEARASIEKFVGSRKFFAHPTFKKEFTTENIMGVYFPYMLVDVNAHATFTGEGEHQTRKYYVKVGDHSEARYDADLYSVERDFDITINDLSVESSSDKLSQADKKKTTNIINSIMPFDTENCVKWKANYLNGFTSEKRDVNIDQLRTLVDVESKDVARYAANDYLKHYDRGVCWSTQQVTAKGQQWQAAYLPVWLYSYQEKGNKKLHYVAVNARTKETMGSVPIYMPKLIGMSILVEILGILGFIKIDFEYNFLFLFTGVVYYLFMYSRYRNAGARHHHETETQNEVHNMKEKDTFIKKRTGLTSSTIDCANNKSVEGAAGGKKFFSAENGLNIANKMLNNAVDSNIITSVVKDNTKGKK